MNKQHHELYFDGGICPHPEGGFACYYGWVIKQNGIIKSTGSQTERKDINVGSCGVELESLNRGLVDAARLGAKTINVFGDTQTVIECLNGNSVQHSAIMSEGCGRVTAAIGQFDAITFTWIPREMNSHADHLAGMGFKRSPEIKKQRSLIRQVNDLYVKVFKDTLDKQTRREWHYSLTGKASLSKMTCDEIKRVMDATYEFLSSVRGHDNNTAQ